MIRHLLLLQNPNDSHFRMCDCIEKTVTEKAVTEKTITEKASIEKAVTEEAVTEKAVTENAVTEKTNISEFCYDGLSCLSDEDCFDGQCMAK